MDSNTQHEIMRSLGRIEGRLDELSGLQKRVAALERWQSWLKGAWAVGAAGFAYILKGLFFNGK